MFDKTNLEDLSTILKSGKNEVADWLLTSLQTKTFTPLIFFDEPSSLIQMRDLYFKLSPENKEKFRSSVINAFKKWHPKNQGISVVEDLALLCGYARIYEALENIRFVIESLSDYEGEHYGDALDTLFAVLGGFAPSPEVEIYLERFYYASNTNYRYIPQIFLGLCMCRPQNYPVHVPRMLNMITKYPEHFRSDYIFSEFVRVVGLNVISKRYFAIPQEYRNLFLDYLCRKGWSPARIVMTDVKPFSSAYGVFITARDTYYALGPEYSGDTQVHFLFRWDDLPTSELTLEYKSIYQAKMTELSSHPVQSIELVL